MTSRVPATQASIKRHIEAARKAGLTVIGIRPDGTVLVSDGENPVLEALRDDVTRHDPEAEKWAIRERA
jgi:hypothetical protein